MRKMVRELYKIAKELVSGNKGTVINNWDFSLSLVYPVSDTRVDEIVKEANYKTKQFIKDVKAIGLKFKHIGDASILHHEIPISVMIVFEIIDTRDDFDDEFISDDEFFNRLNENLRKKGYKIE